MSFFQQWPYPVFVSSGAIATSGSTENLNSGQLALVDVKTGNVLSTTDLNGVAHPEVLIAMGNYHTVDKLSKFIGGLKQSNKTQDFLGKDVIEFHVSNPVDLKQDIVQIGWDGVNDCDSLAFECGKSYRFKVSVSGEDVFRTYSRPLYRFIQLNTKCCANGDCIDSCDDGVACKTYARQLANLINNDVELKYFVKAEAVSSDFSATAITHHLQTLSVCDNGTVVDLAAVQTAYPTRVVTRVARHDSTSIYQVCVLTDTSLAAFTPTGSILQSVCGVCPTGYTTVPGSNVYTVIRPITPSTDLNDGTAQQTFADSIGTAYETATAVTFDASVTNVNVTANTITLTAHGFETGDLVTYNDGGGTAITGITSTSSYYVIKIDADTIKLATTAALALAGTGRDLTVVGVGVSHTLTPVITATFASQNSSSAIVTLFAPAGVELSALLSDTVLFSHQTGITCTPAGASPISWVVGEGRYLTKRTLCMTLGRGDCNDSNRLAELQAFYANNTTLASAITVSQAGECADSYTVDQWSDSCQKDGCLSVADAHFEDLPGFPAGGITQVWSTDCPCDSTTDGPVGVVNCGVRITGAYVDTKFGDCSFQPTDYFSTRPLRINVTQVDESGNPCDISTKVTKIQSGTVATQSGEWLRRQYLKAASLEAYNIWNTDPRIREVFDTQFMNFIDKNKRYKCYYVVYNMNRFKDNGSTYPTDKFETIIAFDEGVDTTAFETLFGGYFSQFGVVLKERG